MKQKAEGAENVVLSRTRYAAEEPKIVFQRPTRFTLDTDSAKALNDAPDLIQRRLCTSIVKPYDFDRIKEQTPRVDVPPRGAPFASIMCPAYQPESHIRVLWDGGAEGTTIRDKCATLIMRNQESFSLDPCAAFNMGRMRKEQRFHGFDDSGTKKV